jgi:hypothetical protein
MIYTWSLKNFPPSSVFTFCSTMIIVPAAFFDGSYTQYRQLTGVGRSFCTKLIHKRNGRDTLYFFIAHSLSESS